MRASSGVRLLRVRTAEDFPNVRIVVPHLPEGLDEDQRNAALKRLLDAYSAGLGRPIVAWYYTPMMLPFSRDLDASVVVFDAMDELSKFKFAPQNLLDLEAIIVGGGLGDRLGQPFVDRIVAQMTPHLFVPEEPPVVLRTELGDLSGAVGAAVLAGG